MNLLRRLFLLLSIMVAAAGGNASPTVSVVQPDEVEFNGPYPGWLNVGDFGAVGDGVHDDTQAIEDALQALGLGLAPAAVYFPNGTYRITRTIQFPHPSFVRGVLGKLVIGQDPATTRLLWDGPQGGDMLWLAGQAHMRYGRLTFDGNDKAAMAIRVERTPQFNLYSSYVQIHDCTFIGSDYGIYNTNRTGTHAMDAEYSVLRCTFIGMKKAGIRIDAGNAYDYWIRHCQFHDCQIGVQNTYGDFYVMQSRFMRSTDADIVARSHRSGGIRDNLSIGSQQFLRLDGGRYVVQGNRVLDLVGDIAIAFKPDFSFTGLLAFANVIHAEHPIQAISSSSESKWGGAPIAIIDNTITSEARFAVAQEAAFLAGNQQMPPGKFDRSIPPLPGTPPKIERPVISLAAGDNDLQAKIDEAAALARATPGQRPVVHIAPGEHTLQTTAIVPPNLPIKIVGDGSCSRLVWAGPRSSVQPALLLQGPSRVTIQDLAFRHHLKQGDTFRSPIADILVDRADQPGARIVSDNSWHSGVFADRLQHTNIDLLDYYSANYGGWLFTTLKAVGPATPGPARIGMFGGVAIGDQIHAHVADGGRVLVQDFWHEENSVMKHPWALAEGQGAQAGLLAIQSAFIFQHGRDPLLHLRGFDGTFALVGNSFGGNSDRIEIVSPAASTALTSLLGWAQLEADTSVPGRQFIYDRRTKTPKGHLDTLRGTLDWLRETRPEAVLKPRPDGVTDVRLHRITALYQNGWGLWARPDEHDLGKPGVSVVASVWDAYEHGQIPGVFTFTRDSTDNELTVPYQLEGAAAEDVLLTPAGGTITFPAGVAQVEVQVTPVDNDIPEEAREVRIRLLPGENHSVGVPRQSERDRIVIHDDDMLQQVWLSHEAVTLHENAHAPGGRRAVIELRRDHPYGDLAVKFTLEGEFDPQDFTQAPQDTVNIPDGAWTTSIVFEAADDDRHEPLESGRLTIVPDAAYLRHPDRVTSTLVEIQDNDPIRVELTPVGDGRFTVARNGDQGILNVPLTMSSGNLRVEETVVLPDGKSQVEVALPAAFERRTAPVTIRVRPFPGSESARLPIPPAASRRWWAVSPTHVVAVDLEKSAWTPAKDKPGTPAIAISLNAPPEWIPADTPPMGVATAYDAVDDRLWVLLAFSRNDAPGPEQTLWRIEPVSTPEASFHQHATFGQVERGVAFDLQLDARRNVLLTYGSGRNGRVAAHVRKDGGVSSQKGADVLAFAADPDGGVWALLSTRFGRQGVRYWEDAAAFPAADGVPIISGDAGHVVAITAIPALAQMALGTPASAVVGHRFAVARLIDRHGASRQLGVLEEKHPGGTTGLYWDPLGRLWIRPQSNQIRGVILDPANREASPQQAPEFTYISVVSFDNEHAYMQQFNGTLQRLRFDNPSIEHLSLACEGAPLLIQSDGDPTGYHWHRTTSVPTLPTITVP